MPKPATCSFMLSRDRSWRVCRSSRCAPPSRPSSSSSSRRTSPRSTAPRCEMERSEQRSASVVEAPSAKLDVARIRADFPILARTVNGKPLVYLDNAATSQKPRSVLEAIASYYTTINANVHRGVHELSGRATDAYEGARDRIRRFFNARSVHEIVYTRNATEGITLVAYSFVRPRLRAGDEVLITAMEHHSNIVPWQIVTEGTGAV